MEPQTFCLAMFNNASVYDVIKHELEEEGHKVLTVAYAANVSKVIGKIEYDYTIRKTVKHPVKLVNAFLVIIYYFKSAFIFLRLLKDVDVFIIIWKSFLPFNLDFPLMKLFRKKLVVNFCGDDVRWFHAMKKDYEANGLEPVKYGDNYNYGFTGFLPRWIYIKMTERFANVIFSRREQAQLQKRAFYHYPPFHPSLKRPSSVHKKQRLRPLIVHATTNPAVKGSLFIIEALKALHTETDIDFDYQLVEGMAREDLQTLLDNADIVIDQLYIPGGGRFTTEALAKGCVVLTNMSYQKYPQGWPKEKCPIVDVDINSIKDVLRKTIRDVEDRQVRSIEAVDYVNKWCLGQHYVGALLTNLSDKPLPHDIDPSGEQIKILDKRVD